MEDRLLRRREVERVTGLSRSGIYKGLRTGAFPLPVRVLDTAVAWRESEILQWIRDLPRASERRSAAGSLRVVDREDVRAAA